jgi:pyruvate,water dikinase
MSRKMLDAQRDGATEGTMILPLDAAEATLPVVGGKGANLARLTRAGFPVPGGFLVTTDAYHEFVAANKLTEPILAAAATARPEDPASLDAASAAIQAHFQAGTLPPELAAALVAAYRALGAPPVAVRSSATAEDLPDMSFAGQQDTYLNIVGEQAVLDAVVRCWASLWTARALGYRARNGIAPGDVALAVVVQEQVPSEASGVLFTANPLTGRRDEVVIDATLGLGEALVSGQVEPDHYVVDRRSRRIRSKTLGAKALAIHGQAGGGTVTVTGDAAAQQALPDGVIADLAALSLRVAQFYGTPQDLEWAWAGGRLFLLQARPITSLFPVPAGLPADPPHVMFSFAAVQGVLDPLTPLGQEAIALGASGFGRMFGVHMTPETQRTLLTAGERLFIDITPLVRNPIMRRVVLRVSRFLDPGVRQALDKLWDDPRLAPGRGRGLPRLNTLGHLLYGFGPILGRVVLNMLRPRARRAAIDRGTDAGIARLAARAAAARTPAQQVAFLDEAVLGTFVIVKQYIIPGLMTGMISLVALQRLAGRLPDAERVRLEMTRGLPHNVTTEMDLALWQTARRIQAGPAALALFQRTSAADLTAAYLAGRLPGPAQAAIAAFMDRYGMRGVAEIDLGRPRWREDPTHIVQVLQSYIQIPPEQAPDVQFKRGAAEARRALGRLIAEVRQEPGGAIKARVATALARRMRIFTGMRESPKFTIIRVFGLVRAGLLQAGQDLVAAGVLDQADDVFYLHRAELRALAAGDTRNWRELVAARRATYAREQARRQIPRLLLSDGEAFYEGMQGGADDGTGLIGSPVSPGVVEGLVHVVRDPRGAQLAPGEILVCPATDPGWTPLFLAAGGLIMEVGGLMTHGSVVAREYGIPAVVGVHDATTRLQTGQRVRVDGSTGHIAILDAAPVAEAG